MEVLRERLKANKRAALLLRALEQKECLRLKRFETMAGLLDKLKCVRTPSLLVRSHRLILF